MFLEHSFHLQIGSLKKKVKVNDVSIRPMNDHIARSESLSLFGKMSRTVSPAGVHSSSLPFG